MNLNTYRNVKSLISCLHKHEISQIVIKIVTCDWWQQTQVGPDAGFWYHDNTALPYNSPKLSQGQASYLTQYRHRLHFYKVKTHTKDERSCAGKCSRFHWKILGLFQPSQCPRTVRLFPRYWQILNCHTFCWGHVTFFCNSRNIYTNILTEPLRCFSSNMYFFSCILYYFHTLK